MENPSAHLCFLCILLGFNDSLYVVLFLAVGAFFVHLAQEKQHHPSDE